MWPFSSRTTRRSQAAHRGTAVRKLCLETLEDRCVPSTAGSLDPTFGNGAGYVTTSISSGYDLAHSALIQPNGEIVAVGSADAHAELAVERYNLNGSLDTSFGSGGIALASFGSGSNNGGSSALDPYAGTANGNDDVVQEGSYNGQYQILARYNTNGTLDSTFGTGGKVMTAFPGMSSYGESGVVVTSAGQIVALNFSSSGGQFVLARYNANGSLDTTFGQGGYVITTVPGGDLGFPSPLLQQPNGDLIVTAAQGVNDSGGVWDLYRFNANGTMDTSFGINGTGIVTTAAPGGASATLNAVLYPDAGTSNDGQIILVGQVGDGVGFAGNGPVDLVRYNSNGTLDTTFGAGGIMQTQLNMGYVQNAALDANGRIVLTGDNTGSTTELARFNVNGTPDTTFGNGGLVTTTVGTSSGGYGVAIYPDAGTANDGDIVVTGWSTGTKQSVLVARYLGEANSPYFTITGPSSVTAGTASTYTISVLNPDGSADTGYSGTVHITSSDLQAVLPANFTITGGTGTFNVTLETAGTQSITATDTTTGSITGSETGIVVSPAAASQVIFTDEPSNGTAGQTLGTVEVTLKDAYGNVETSDNSDKVTLSVKAGPSTTLGGTLTETVAAGNAIFSNLLLDTSGSYTLAALASLTGGGTLGPVVSSSFTVASPVSLSYGSLTYNSKTGVYSETVTVTNTTSGTLTGPMSLELTGLPSGVVLTNATGTTNGNPYIDFLTSGKTLKKGASTSITLTFSDPTNIGIVFAAEVLVGL